MNSEQKKAAKRYLSELMAQVPNFVQRVAAGELKASATSGVQASVARIRRNSDQMGYPPTFGIMPAEADRVVQEFVREMTGGKIENSFRSAMEE